MNMLLQFVLCWAWGLLILASFIGWGWIVSRVFFKNQVIDIGLKACWGLSVFVLLGGVLNLFCLIYSVVLFTIIGLGILFFFNSLYTERKKTLYQIRILFKEKKVLVAWIICVLFLVLCKYTFAIHNEHFNVHDDYHGYLVYPTKMIQMHSLGADPFNDRQMVSSLGGLSFLQTLIISIFPIDFVNIMDHGIGLLLMGLLVAFWKEKSFQCSFRIFLIAVFVFMPLSTLIVNISSVILPIALFLGLFRVFERSLSSPQNPVKNAAVIALIALTICTLKSNNLIFVGLFLSASYILKYIKSRSLRRSILCELCLVVIFMLAMLSPWMISMYRSSGTAFYPMLGKGYHASAYDSVRTQAWDLRSLSWYLYAVFSNPYVFVFLILAGFYLYRNKNKFIDGYLFSSVIFSVFLGYLIIAYTTQGIALDRYTISFLCFGIIVLLKELLCSVFDYEKQQFCGSKCFTLLVAIGVILGWGQMEFYPIAGNVSNHIKSLFNETPLVVSEEQDCYFEAQRAIPESEVILARLQKPFLLDFQRNTIYIPDWPGQTSPPPGLPFAKGPEAVADYLTSCSIRYVIYSYAEEAGFQKERLSARLEPSMHVWVRLTALKTFDFQDNLDELMLSRKRIYDDGDICVIDLQQSLSVDGGKP